MKKILITISLAFCSMIGFSQNVGIGTSIPNASAILDVTSGNKGVMFPRISLFNTIDGNAVPNPATNLIVFNINDALTGGKGLFFNAGTPASPNWSKVGDLKLPYYNATSSPSAAFRIENYQSGLGGTAIKGYSQNSFGIEGTSPSGVGVEGSSANGYGVHAFSTSGTALAVNGRINILGTDQTPGLGKVLTSDAVGNATWEGAVAFSSYGIQPDGAAAFSSGVEKKVAFYSEEYDLGNDYTTSVESPYSTFTTPVKGIFHFDLKTTWEDNPSSGASTLNLKSINNGVTKLIIIDLVDFNGEYHNQNNISIDVLLEANSQVFATMHQTSGSVQSLLPSNNNFQRYCYFNGRLVVKL